MAITRASTPTQGAASILQEFGQEQDLKDTGLLIAKYKSVLWRALPTIEDAKEIEFEFNVDSVTHASDTLAASCTVGDTTITVTDASLYEIGETIALPDPTTMTVEIGRITALNESTNVLTLATRPYAGTKAVATIPNLTTFKKMGKAGDFDSATAATAVSEPGRRWWGYIQQFQKQMSFEDVLDQVNKLRSGTLNGRKKKCMETMLEQINQAFLYGPVTTASYIVGKAAASGSNRCLTGGVLPFIASRAASKIDDATHGGTLDEDEFFTYLMLPIVQGGRPGKIFVDAIGLRCLEAYTRAKVETGQENAMLQRRISEVASTAIPAVKVYLDDSIGYIETDSAARTGRILVLDTRYVGKRFLQKGGHMKWQPDPHTGNVTTGFFRMQTGLQISHPECHLDICQFSGPA